MNVYGEIQDLKDQAEARDKKILALEEQFETMKLFLNDTLKIVERLTAAAEQTVDPIYEVVSKLDSNTEPSIEIETPIKLDDTELYMSEDSIQFMERLKNGEHLAKGATFLGEVNDIDWRDHDQVIEKLSLNKEDAAEYKAIMDEVASPGWLVKQK